MVLTKWVAFPKPVNKHRHCHRTGLHGSGPYQLLGIQHEPARILCSEVLINFYLDPTIFLSPMAVPL